MTQQKKGSSAPVRKKRKRGKKALPQYIWFMLALGVAAVIGGYFLDQGIGAVSVTTLAAQKTSDSTICISEVMTSNQSAAYTRQGVAADWFEVENTGSAPVNLKGYEVRKASDVTAIFAFPAVTLAAGETAVVYCDALASTTHELHAPFKLSASGETLQLLDAQGAQVQLLEVPPMQKNQAYARDEEGNWQITGAASPGQPNKQAVAAQSVAETSAGKNCPVVISEIMASNATYAAPDGGCYDYIELHNTSGQAYSLEGFGLSDTRANPMKWTFPDVSIPAGGYLVVYLSGQNSQDASFLQADFKLSSDGESAVLSGTAGQTLDAVDFPALLPDQAYSLAEGAFTTNLAPTPGAPNDFGGVAQTAGAFDARNTTGVFLSEVMTSTSKADYDWVEIYNSTGQSVDLSGWGLSDKASAPRKWQFPQGTTIAPYSYLGVYMSGLTGTTGGLVNAGFRLSVDGGYTLTLSNGDGVVLDRMYIPQQYAEISYGRVLGQAGFYYFDTATPGAVNVSGYTGRVEMAKASVPGGLFEESDAFRVELSAPAGARIYYTLDCSEPDETKNLYTGPIEISMTTVLRTRVYADGQIPSYIDTQTYLFGTAHSAYVVSLVSEQDNLFGANGIYDNYQLTSEVPGHVEVFQPDGSGTVLSQGCGIKLHGDYSRAEDQKAFKIYARSQYGGGNTFQVPLISNRDYTEYSSFLLRSSGQDTNKTRMRDSVLTSLAADTSVYYQETEICVVYINGQYWGQYYIREHITAYSICQFEGWEGQEDDIDLIKANSTVFQGSNATFEELLNWVKTNNTNTDEAYQHIASVIDIQNYIEYMAIEIYTGNTDTLNVKRYRNALDDGLWRWVLYDLDWALTVDTDSLNRWLTPGGMGNGKRTDNTLFIACMKNDTFRDQFLTYFGQKLATDFSTENILAMFEARYYELKPELPAQLARWGETESSYQAALKELIDYVKQRPTLILQRAQATFGFSDAEMMRYFGDARAKIEEG